jgi:CRP/FNR family transcriptional regulator, cyclic AMP receptor protein
MESTVLTDVLGSTWFATGIPAPARDRLAALGRVVDYPIGAIVVQEGTICRDLGVVVRGLISLRLAVPGGTPRPILTVDAGDVFGWSAILPPAIATSTAVTVVPTRAVLFDGRRLMRALTRDCELGAAVYERVLVAVARRLSATRMQLLDLYAPTYEPW